MEPPKRVYFLVEVAKEHSFRIDKNEVAYDLAVDWDELEKALDKKQRVLDPDGWLVFEWLKEKITKG